MIHNGQTITTSLFLDSLKKLNPSLRVCSFEGSTRLAGLYLINKQGEWEDICGVDKQLVPAYATFDNGGHVIKSGWRRVFWMLWTHGYTDKLSIRAVCPGFFDSRAVAADKFTGGVLGDAVGNKIAKYAIENFEKGEELLTNDQVLDVAQDIHAKDSDVQKLEREKDAFFLQKWAKNGGGVKDRPNY
jgi:hypothetical protein